MDKTTRRPTPINEKWRGTYESHCVRGEPLIVPKEEEPEGGPLNVYEVSSYMVVVKGVAQRKFKFEIRIHFLRSKEKV